MSIEEQEKQNAELRAKDKYRPLISPRVWTTIQRVPIKAWLILAVLILSFFAFRAAMYEVRKEARNLAIAEMAEKQAQESLRISNEFQEKLRNLRNDNAKLIADLNKEKDKFIEADRKRQSATAKTIEKVKSKITTIEVSEDVKNFLKIIPESSTDTTLTFNVADVKTFVVTQIERDNFEKTIESLQHRLTIEEQKGEIKDKELTAAYATINSMETTIVDLHKSEQAYKKAAKKSFFGKLVGGVKTVGTAVIPALIVYLVMQGD